MSRNSHAPVRLAGSLLALLALAGCRTVVDGGSGAALPFHYRHLVETSPRPLQIHDVRYDLRDRTCEVACVVASADPDTISETTSSWVISDTTGVVSPVVSGT